MSKNKTYRYFSKNNPLLNALGAMGTAMSLLTIGFIIGSLPLWAILSVGIVAILFITGFIITAKLLRCKISYDGIVVPTAHKQKQFLSWSDIQSVQISCKLTRYITVYVIELKSDILSLSIKTYRDVAEAIKTFSADSESFHSMFLQNLNKAEIYH
ncbi:MAG: hypothetical protein J1F71_02650 [Clostridiales bacterium]|nr:hypothetical protein [Clostridiales bacterium]